MKRLKCKICECEFVPEKKDHYISRDEVTVGFSSIVGGMEEKNYDTFDCPQCGCQNIVGERKRMLFHEFLNNLEEEEEETEESEHEEEESIPAKPHKRM